MPDHAAQVFQSVFENSPVGLVLVNKDVTLRAVNQYMFRAFNISQQDVHGTRFGNLFNCVAVSDSAEMCGQSDQCKNCSLRNGILSVLNDGVAIPDTVMDHHFNVRGTRQNKWFIISASRIISDDDVFAVVSFADITTQKEYEVLLNNQLSIDITTGITNKYTLLSALKSLAVGQDGLALALIDFDDLKSINEVYGQIVGDKILKTFCMYAQTHTRKQDVLGRFGGQEFMLIFPGASAGLIIQALRRVDKLMRDKCENEFGVIPTFSVGLAEYSRDHLYQMDVSALIAEVDANLYQAKKRGKNMIVVGGISVPFQSDY